jgi:hypothetical protein
MKQQMIKKIFTLTTAVFFTGIVLKSAAQEQPASKLDSIATEVLSLRHELDFLKNLKISGYVQAQAQFADSTGTATYAGGNFPTASDKRILIRRGRIKFDYSTKFTQTVFQIDITEKGFATKDAYLKVTDPFLQCFSLTAGVFNRPFGYEIAYSSSMRESPERSRFTQTLFPGERDLGGMITFNPPKTSRFNWFKINAGMFCGNGINPETDKQKDFIGQIRMDKSVAKEKIKLGLGLSYYNGGVYQGTKYIYSMQTLNDAGTKGFAVDSAASNKGVQAWREYYGADGQLSIDFPFGITTLRGEYVMGHQPGTSSSTTSPNASTLPASDTYKRDFTAGYGYLCQNIGKTKHQVVVKVDWYDPNINVSGKGIASTYKNNSGATKTTKLSGADLKYTTWGFGYIFHIDQNFKMMAYYDMVKNETTSISKLTKDLRDNVFTLRFQYKF